MSSKKILTAAVVQGIIDAYQGVEHLEGGRKQRVFLWEDGDEIRLGNTYAYAEFLGVSWGSIHKVLRDAGHQLWNAPRVSRGDLVGEFRDPEPVSIVVGHVPSKDAPRSRKQIVIELAETFAKFGVLFNELLDRLEKEGDA